jgi:hypothetical protein
MESRWWVEVWTVPPGKSRYRDAHPEHRALLAAEGKGETTYCGTVESVGRVANKIYKTRTGAEKAAEQLRNKYARLPQVYVEIVTGGVLTGFSL